MRLMEKPYSRQEKDNVLDMLQGCICRVCVSEDPLEIVRMVGFATMYINMLAQSRMLEISSEGK